MICLRLTPKFHVHFGPAKRYGFVRARAHYRNLNEWGYLGKRITIWWSSVDREEHF